MDKAKIVEEESIKEFEEAINAQTSDSVKAKLLALYTNQEKREQILEKGYNEEYYSLEYGYNVQYNQIVKEIAAILNAGSAIPHYWKTAIENSKYLPVNDKDKEILKHLTDIEIIFNEVDKKSFTLRFLFSENPYFEHSALEKTYTFNKKDDTYTEAKSTEIKWKGDAPNKKIVKKKIKKGKTNSTITKEKKVDSFFNIFEDKEDEDEDGDDEEKEESDELGSEADFFLNDLVPFSMEYYLDLQKLSAINDEAIDEDEDEDEDEKPKKKK